jgi:hypothetical protein
VCISPYQLLNAWINLYKTWYVYHGTWAYLNGLIKKSLRTVCVSPIVARQRLGRNVTAAMNTHASFSVWPVSYQGK